MNKGSTWQYNEFKQIGKDYGEPQEAAKYDSRHADFRDIEKESNVVLDALGVGMDDVVIDFGAGTGTLAIQAARRGAKVYAVDVSQAMIALAKAKTAEAAITNVEFRHGGFLSYQHEGPSADFIVTTFALHHLPDFWKGIALSRLFHMLERGGKLYVHDVIIEERRAIDNIEALIDKLAARGGDVLREDAEAHFREEYSTYDWVMDGLLSRAGFTIESKNIQDGVLGTYYCTKD